MYRENILIDKSLCWVVNENIRFEAPELKQVVLEFPPKRILLSLLGSRDSAKANRLISIKLSQSLHLNPE